MVRAAPRYEPVALVEGHVPHGDPRNRPQPNSISLGFSFAHLLRTSNQVDSCVQSSANVMSARGAVVSKNGTPKFVWVRGIGHISPQTEPNTAIGMSN